jgi:hypothetical protein
LYVNVRFAGPLFAHSAQSDVISGWLECERRMLGRGGDSVEDAMPTVGSRYSRVGGRAEEELSEGRCERECERRMELEAGAVEREESEGARESDDERDGDRVEESDETCDQNPLLVSDVARLRVDIELREDTVLRADEVVLFVVLCRSESLRLMSGCSSPTSGDGGGDGYTADETQLGSSS